MDGISAIMIAHILLQDAGQIKNTLVVKANLIGECIGKVIMQFSFKKDGAVTIFSRKTEEILFGEYSGFAQSN